MRQIKENFLGRGPRFPITLDTGTGGFRKSAGAIPYYKVDSAEDLKRIQGSIEHILSTPVGSRYYLPEFGSRLKQLLFEQNDDVLIDLLRVYIIEALAQWEPRIEITDVISEIDSSDDSRVNCNIKYIIIDTQVSGNYIYPFYRKF